MKSIYLFTALVILLFFAGLSIQSSCKKKSNNSSTDQVWDIETQGVPKFAVNYIDCDKISKISRYRSSAGHDYSDFTESCRSMKHYFYPKDTVNWTQIQIYSPVGGRVTRVEQEWAGTKIEIESSVHPAFRFMIFHVAPIRTFSIGDQVEQGAVLGHHIGFETWSDISVFVNDPTKQGRLLSFFETLTDEAFAMYQNHGIASRSDLIISKSLRDQYPLQCNGDGFTSADSLDVWVLLH